MPTAAKRRARTAQDAAPTETHATVQAAPKPARRRTADAPAKNDLRKAPGKAPESLLESIIKAPVKRSKTGAAKNPMAGLKENLQQVPAEVAPAETGADAAQGAAKTARKAAAKTADPSTAKTARKTGGRAPVRTSVVASAGTKPPIAESRALMAEPVPQQSNEAAVPAVASAEMAAPGKASVRKATARKSAAKPAAEKLATEKLATEKPATEKPATEKPATEKRAGQATVEPQGAAQEQAPVQAAPDKVVAKKGVAKKVTAEKAVAKKAVAKKAAAKKSPVKQAAAKRPVGKRAERAEGAAQAAEAAESAEAAQAAQGVDAAEVPAVSKVVAESAQQPVVAVAEPVPSPQAAAPEVDETEGPSTGERRRRRDRGRRAGRAEAAPMPAAPADASSIEPSLPTVGDVLPDTRLGVPEVPAAEGAEAPAPAAPALPPRPVLALADPAHLVCEAPVPGGLFGRYRVTDRRDGEVYEVRVRGLAEGENRCSCSAFAADDQARCPHVHTVLAGLLDAGPESHAALLAGEPPAATEVFLRWGAQRRIVWRAAADCPAELRRRFEAALDAQGCLPLGAATLLQQLVRLAAELGHPLVVEEAVWRQLEEGHDAQRRVQVLEAAYPAGPADASLQHGLLRQPLALHQAEAALLAACAGRCALGDEPGLGKITEVLATLALQRRHFGAERLMIAAPDEWLRRWQRAVTRWSGLAVRRGLDELAATPDTALRLVSLEALRAGVDGVAAWGPDVLVIDEGLQEVAPWTGEFARLLDRVDPASLLIVLRRPLTTRPDAADALVRRLDPLRLGPTQRLIEAHAGPHGWHDLDRLGETLLPLLVQRRRDSARAAAAHGLETGTAGVPTGAPFADDDIHTLPLTEVQAAWHRSCRERAERLVVRWERVGQLSSREQRELLTALHDLAGACVGESSGVAGNEAAADPKTAALLALLEELSAHTAEVRLVVFSAWPSALDRLAGALQRRGIGCCSFGAGASDAALAQAAAAFGIDPDCRVALVDDRVVPRLRLHAPQAGVVHLDRPWDPERLTERLRCVSSQSLTAEAGSGAAADEAGVGAGVPVLHLIAESSIEEALLDDQTIAAALGTLPLGAALAAALAQQPAGHSFLGGPALATLIQQVRELLRLI